MIKFSSFLKFKVMRTILVLIFAISFVNCANILAIFPTPLSSHQEIFHGYIKDLVSRGHRLTILTTNVMKVLISNENVTQIDLHESREIMRRKINSMRFNRSPSELSMMDASLPVLVAYLESQFSNPGVMKLIRNDEKQHFDVIILEHSVNHPYLAFAEIFNAPIIGITPSDAFNAVHQDFGNIVNPLIHADILFPFSHDGDLNFDERWKSLKFHLEFYFFTQSKYNRAYEKLMRAHFPHVKSSIDELKNRIQLLMLNTNPIMGFSRPLLPNTIQLGFLHVEEPKKIENQEIQEFLDNSPKGVIVVSLGRSVQSKNLEIDIKNSFINTFKDLPSYRILWKYESDELSGKLSNVLTKQWLQQSDILAHSNVKLFITQGGQMSMEEAIEREVPMVVIPFTSDQTSNAKRVVNKQIGVHLELCKLNVVTLKTAIHEALKPEIKENIKKLKILINDQPMKSRELAIWWTEFIIRNKGVGKIEYTAKHVPFYIKFGLDFAALAISIFAFVLICLRLIFRKIIFISKPTRNSNNRIKND